MSNICCCDCPHLGFAQGKLALAIALLCCGLGCVGALMGLKIEFAYIGRHPVRLFLLLMEEVEGVRVFASRGALKVLLSAQVFQVLAGRATTAITPTIGNQA